MHPATLEPTAPPPAPVRPGSVTFAAIALIVLGGLVGLLGLLAMLVGALAGTVGQVPPELSGQLGGTSLGAAGGLVVLAGLFLAGFGGLGVTSGIGALVGRGWARPSGMIAAMLGLTLSLVGIFPVSDGALAGGVVSFLLVATYAFSMWALTTASPWFTRPAGG